MFPALPALPALPVLPALPALPALRMRRPPRGKPRSRAPALRLIAAAAAAGALAACAGGPRPPPPPAPAAARGKAFAPLTIQQDARAPDQAVILGTDPQDGSTILPIAGAPAARRVDALYVRPPAAGGASPVTLTASPAPAAGGSVHAAPHDQLPGDAGAAWRAGVWMAAVAAAHTLGKDPTDLALGAAPGGYLDGAAASGLIAAGFLAAITGARLDPAATMAGAIHPDGTIGPIGPVTGLPEMFRAAIAAGKKKLGYPSGLRRARSAATGELIDLAQLARAGGAEAIEIADVHDAYALLTGRALPEPVPVSAQEMQLDDPTAKALDAAYRDWQQRLGGEWAALLQLQQGGYLPRALLQLAHRTQALGERAEQLHRLGAVAAAYGKIVEAWVLAASAIGAFEVLVKARQGDVPAAVAALDQLDQRARRALEPLEPLGAIRPATVADHLRLASALGAALRGWSFQALAAGEVMAARRYLEGLARKRTEELATPAAADALVTAVAPAIVLLGRIHAEALGAQQRLEHERASAPAIDPACAAPDAPRLAAALHAAAAAAVGHLDALLVEPAARRDGVPLDTARARLALDEPDYLVAYALARPPAPGGPPHDLREKWGDRSPAWALMSLAAGELAYATSAALIAKHGARQLRADPAGGPDAAAASGPALARLLASAEQAARAGARAARIATGAIPVQARLAYQQAAAARAGDLADQLDALTAYWRSSASSQAAVRLARNQPAGD